MPRLVFYEDGQEGKQATCFQVVKYNTKMLHLNSSHFSLHNHLVEEFSRLSHCPKTEIMDLLVNVNPPRNTSGLAINGKSGPIAPYYRLISGGGGGTFVGHNFKGCVCFFDVRNCREKMQLILPRLKICLIRVVNSPHKTPRGSYVNKHRKLCIAYTIFI